ARDRVDHREDGIEALAQPSPEPHREADRDAYDRRQRKGPADARKGRRQVTPQGAVERQIAQMDGDRRGPREERGAQESRGARPLPHGKQRDRRSDRDPAVGKPAAGRAHSLTAPESAPRSAAIARTTSSRRRAQIVSSKAP